MTTAKYIALDIETGGLGVDKSFLTAYFAILDKELNIIDELYLYCKPKDGIYHVTAKGMEVNGIDLVEHDKIADTYQIAGTKLYQFLNQHEGPLIAIGHNVRFDMVHIYDKLISQENWWHFISYRTLDTGVIGGFAIDLGLLPRDINAGLNSLAKYLNVGTQSEKHDAKEDTLLSVGVYKELKKLFAK